MVAMKACQEILKVEPAEEYHRRTGEFLTSHLLGDFRHSPALYYKKKLGLLENADRPAYVIGRAVHALVLEGRAEFDRQFAIGGPINPKTGKPFGANTNAFQDWASAQGKTVLTDDQYALISKIVESVSAHSGAHELLAEGQGERVTRTEYCGVPCQTRMDWFNPRAGIVDLKTCDDLTWFEADARRYDYLYQIAFYRAVLACAQVQPARPCHIIAVEKKEPFRCGVWLVDEGALNFAQKENESAIERLKECQVSGYWPTGYEERRVLDSI